MEKKDSSKPKYVKPELVTIDVKPSGIVCTSGPNQSFYMGGGGTYNEGDIVNNGDY